MKHFYHLAFSLLLPCIVFAQASQTITITATSDNTIFQEAENSNALGANLFAGDINFGAGYARRAMISFQLSGVVPAGSTIVSASVKLFCNKVPAGAVTDNVKFHKLTAGWGEATSDAGSDFDGNGMAATPGDATWLQRFFGTTNWTATGGDYVATASATTSVGAANIYYTWSSAQLAADVQSWVITPANNFGWLVIGDEVTPKTVKRYSSRENTDPAQQPQLTITYRGPVPVTLAAFTAKETSKGIQLNWQTQQELNNAWFDVQYSSNGTQFNTIGRINGAGNSTTIKNYDFVHTGIEAGKHFYRLAQTDFDGKINYSPVVQLSTKGIHYTITISPNPVAASIQLTGSAYQKGNAYTVFSQNGTAVLQGKLQSPAINTAGLAAGSYILKLEQQGASALYGRFIKQ
jgi:hypothetical protein